MIDALALGCQTEALDWHWTHIRGGEPVGTTMNARQKFAWNQRTVLRPPMRRGGCETARGLIDANAAADLIRACHRDY